MIKNDREYARAVERVSAEKARLTQHRKRLREHGLTGARLKRALDPLRTVHLQLVEEVETYERLKRGEFGEVEGLGGLGRQLVALRIAQGLSQRALADRLGVHESQVSRDERNDYHGITVDRAARVLEALGIGVTIQFTEIVRS